MHVCVDDSVSKVQGGCMYVGQEAVEAMKTEMIHVLLIVCIPLCAFKCLFSELVFLQGQTSISEYSFDAKMITTTDFPHFIITY